MSARFRSLRAGWTMGQNAMPKKSKEEEVYELLATTIIAHVPVSINNIRLIAFFGWFRSIYWSICTIYILIFILIFLKGCQLEYET